MSPLLRFFYFVCLGIVLAAHSSAQNPPSASETPSEETVRAWLLSDDPRLVAWGAHYALITGSKNLIPDLLDVASRWQPLPQPNHDSLKRTDLSETQIDKRDAMAAVVDSLIQMNVPVSPGILRVLAPDFGNGVAVLLTRLPLAESSSLSMEFYQSPGLRGHPLHYVSAVLLARNPPRGFAADMLTNTTVFVQIFIVPPNGEKYEYGHSDGDCFVPSVTERRDWPTTGQYELSVLNGQSLVVEGVNPVYVARKKSTRYLDGCAMSFGVHLGPRERRRLITQMLDVPLDQFPWEIELTANVEFQSLGQFISAVLALVNEERKKYRMTSDELEARGLLTHLEAVQSFPKLTLHLDDHRNRLRQSMQHHLISWSDNTSLENRSV